MEIYIVSLDGDDMPEEPVTAESCAHAAEIYVREILAGRASVDQHSLKKAPCIWVNRFEAPEEFGLMRDTESTSIPRSYVPSWKAFLDGQKKEEERDVYGPR